MTTSNKTLNSIALEKQLLIRQLDRKEISQEEFDTKYAEAQRKTSERVSQLYAEQKELDKKELLEEEIKMPEVKVDKPKKPGKEASPTSYTGLILKALKMKSLKDIDAVVEKVHEWKDERDKKKTKTQANTIIGLIKKQNPARWKKYEWNEESFLVTEKED